MVSHLFQIEDNERNQRQSGANGWALFRLKRTAKRLVSRNRDMHAVATGSSGRVTKLQWHKI